MGRKILLEEMRKKGIREGLVERVQNYLRETRCRMKVQGGKMKERFWTAKEVRQGCLLS